MQGSISPRKFFRLNRTAAAVHGVALGLVLWLIGCSSAPVLAPNPLTGAPLPGRISVMAYNVENLFDTTHDQGKKDFTYLPASEKRKNTEVQAACRQESGYRAKECRELDWSDDAVKKKIQAISDGILQVRGQGPDILILEEVENINILKRLRDEGLKNSNYQTLVLLEGGDIRGIDVGFLSRFPLAGKPQLHTLEFSKEAQKKGDAYPTRGILEIPVQLPNGSTLYVFGVHLPSQANPVEERRDAVLQLVRILKSKGPDALWVVGGDWNITGLEDDETGLISKHMAEIGWVSHIVGCKSCKGTHMYRGLWDFLDILVFSRNMGAEGSGAYELLPETIWTPKAGRLQLQPNGRPARFDLEAPIGISDHLPIYAELGLRK